MELQKIFGANVRNHRKARGLTQEALAERVEVSMETIGKIERGSTAPTFATAERLASALDIQVTVLFGHQSDGMPEGNRGKLLANISRSLSSLNDEQLFRLAKMIDAFAGK
ncbi:helix-turn-helix domain-containing protein [Agrobacterium sp. 22-211-1]|uniref:helix-turn-helix domain-containing protein n=1 Tax=Agrobacterium tomkonis TaxID=1183410 RepID=UPI001CDA3D6E|nr:helix-turn-helix transcriptional regulator [Agrobacterium tomkonis RTP8]